MFKERYQALYHQVSPASSLVQEIKRQAGAQKTTRKKSVLRRASIVVAAVMVFFIIAIPTLAVNVPQIRELMRFVAPEIAQYFTPVQKSCEDNGIQMEVVSAYIHENVAEIYITMTDLTDDRIDESMDLYDSYRIHRPFDSSATCNQVGYDARTKTATFLIEISQWDGRNIDGDKITFSIREFLSHKKEYKDLPIPIDLAQAGEGTAQRDVYINGLSASERMQQGEDPEVLVTTREIALPFPEITMTGIGYLDGQLHIQTKIYDRLAMDHHGFVYLKNTSGEVVHSKEVVYFTNGKEGAAREDFCEFVFDVPKTEIAEYRAFGEFYISGMKTEGNWQVTFSLENKKE